jgi:RNA polymerase sigma-70 factor (ECF subfamily)
MEPPRPPTGRGGVVFGRPGRRAPPNSRRPSDDPRRAASCRTKPPATTPPPDVAALLSAGPWVRGLARELCRDDAAADDVVQDTWLAALQAPLDAVRSPRGWLGQIARRFAFQDVRRRARRERREKAVARPEAGPAADDAAQRLETHRRLVDAVLALEEPYRTVVVLRYFEDLAPRAIATRLGLPATTVRNRLSRALAHLRARFDREEGSRAGRLALLLPLFRAGRGGAAAVVAAAAFVVVVAAAAAVYALRSRAADAAPAPDAARASAPETPRAAGAFDVGRGAVAATPFAEPERPTLAVQVVGVEGAPVAGASVYVAPSPDGPDAPDFFARAAATYAPPTPTTTTDAAGRATLAAPPYRARVVAVADGRLPDAAEPVDGAVELVLSPAEAVEAVLLDADGAPVADAEALVAYDELRTPGAPARHVARRRTDPRGVFRADLPRGTVADGVRVDPLVATPGLLVPRLFVRRAGAADLAGELFYNRPLDEAGRPVFALRRGGAVALELTTADGGPPDRPLAVFARFHRDAVGRAARSDDDGVVRLDDAAPEGRLRVAVADPAWCAVGDFAGDPAAARLGFASASPPRAPGDPYVAPVRRTPTVRGVVLDAETGAPLPQVAVRAWPDPTWVVDRGRLAVATTDADGTFALRGLPATRIEVEIADPRYVADPSSGDGLPDAEDADAARGARIAAVRRGPFRLACVADDATPPLAFFARPRGVVSGTAVDADRKPLGGARVVAASPEDDDRVRPAAFRDAETSTTTDAAGRFALPGARRRADRPAARRRARPPARRLRRAPRVDLPRRGRDRRRGGRAVAVDGRRRRRPARAAPPPARRARRSAAHAKDVGGRRPADRRRGRGPFGPGRRRGRSGSTSRIPSSAASAAPTRRPCARRTTRSIRRPRASSSRG